MKKQEMKKEEKEYPVASLRTFLKGTQEDREMMEANRSLGFAHPDGKMFYSMADKEAYEMYFGLKDENVFVRGNKDKEFKGIVRELCTPKDDEVYVDELNMLDVAENYVAVTKKDYISYGNAELLNKHMVELSGQRTKKIRETRAKEQARNKEINEKMKREKSAAANLEELFK
jgi:hypothetical protein